MAVGQTKGAVNDWQAVQPNDWQEVAPAESDTESGTHSFFSNLLPDAIMHPVNASEQNFQEFKQHPVRTLVENAIGGPALPALAGAFQGAKRSGSELLNAGKSLLDGNPAEAAVHGINAVPIVGPALVNAANKPDVGGTGSYLGDLKSVISSPSAMGTLTGASVMAAPALLGGLDASAPERGIFGEIPTRARAAARFESLNNDLANHPVPLKSTIAPLQRATELGVRGGTLPKPVSDLLTRSQATIDPTYPEIRDYQSNLSDLSREAKNSMNGKMKGAVGKVNQGLYQDIYDSANQAGRGEDYAKAMQQFRQAAQLRDLAIKSAKIAAPVGAAAMGAHALTPYLRKLF